jgi:hypothetical protein
MSRRWLLSLLCLSAVVVFVQLASANGGLKVNESATRFLIQDQATVLLEVVNPASHSLAVHLNLDLLDPKDIPQGMAVRNLTLQPGLNKLSIPLTLTAQNLNKAADAELLWYRLRYRIAPAPEADSAPDAASGIMSLSEIDTPDIFALKVSTPRNTSRGARQYTHVRALHPLTGKPVPDVDVRVELNLDRDPKQTLRGSTITDADGYALVILNIPARLNGDEGELKVVAQHGGYIQEASNDIELNDTAQIIITADKPIYQPGQPLHVRALALSSVHHAAANAKATLKISDPEQTTVFQTELVTSRFGVASADWNIPDNTRLGVYGISVELDDDNYNNSMGYQAVKISRYDLPNFTVSVKPDRSFYLPGQNAELEVRADYLFGQPVKRGHVRVLREEDRSWNYREQKWDVTGGDKYEGETDDSGRFLVQVDLGADHEELKEEDYSRFKDLTYAAYFTDPTSNRTEQRRFDLRVTKDAIHIYVAEGRYRQTSGFPMQFFLATSYADGTPAPCEVAISQADDDDDRVNPVIKTIRTNKYGIAKVTGINLTETNDSPSLSFTARNNNSTGRHVESFYYRSVPVVRVETEKALYRPGEPIKVSIKASKPQLNLFIDVARDSNIIESRSLTLSDGAATFTLDYRAEFQDEVTISAYSPNAADAYSYDYIIGSRTVLFPRDRDLKLNLHLDHAEYKPGAEATADFRISTPDGRPVSSALGVVIFDRAVEERARTDQDFSGGFGFYGSFSQWRGYDDQVGSITRKDLQRVDLTKALPEGIESVAELLLSADPVRPVFFETNEFAADHRRVFSESLDLYFKPLRNILDGQYKNGVYPENRETLRRLLFESGVEVDQLRDPWGTVYREVFSFAKADSIFDIVSAGPDKVFNTADDLTSAHIVRPYFRFTGEAISRAVERFHSRTGGFIRDLATLKGELQTEGVGVDALRDPWGQPYDFSFPTVQNNFLVTVTSSGPDKHFDQANPEKSNPNSDDFTLWTASIDYLPETRALVKRALAEYIGAANSLPRDDNQLQRALAAIDQSKLKDPWGHRYYAVYQTQSRYTDRASLQTVGVYGQPTRMRTEITPITQTVLSVQLRSSGADGKEGTADDFGAVEYSQVTDEESAHESKAAQPAKRVGFFGSTGAIKGTVIDRAGAAIPGAKVTAALKNSSEEFAAETDDSGNFVLRNLPAGFYTVRCDAASFKSTIITEVQVSSANLTTLDLTLEVGGVSEVVTVSSDVSATINTTSSSVATTVTEGRMRVSIGKPVQLSTPRLREYFPETLVWQPALETDQQGRAQLKFKLADNITTWKMSVIGSTEDGEVGTAETEIKSFQPFFVEHDPPRVLTEGDKISLPVVLRNYLERAQAVDLEIKPESWFTLLGPARQHANVPAGDAARETFELQAIASVKDGKQRITAGSSEANDAIEKPVTVHPDGEEKTLTSSDVFGDTASLKLDLPGSVIPGSTRAELKIYPNLMAHVVESIEGILERPHGCGEQTISSTYPSLLVLRNQQSADSSPLGRKAKRYAELGYQRLLNYRNEDGGFTYWGHGDADLALTAYALRFLHDARQFVAIDDDVPKAARQWIIKRQLADGSWPVNNYYLQDSVDQRRSALLTAFIARVLAMTEPAPALADSAAPKQESGKNGSSELSRALSFLTAKSEAIDEPHLIASYALAALDAGDLPAAARAAARLRSLAHSEGETTYWSLETNTPFYGWGLAGRVETTALAVQALARFAKIQTGSASITNDPLVRSGLLFLLRQKDRYGVWYSTQATINVLDTLVTLLATDAVHEDKKSNGATAPVWITVNGQPATLLDLPRGDQREGENGAVVRTDISRFLRNGVNQVELRRNAGSEFASIQMVANYYVTWGPADQTPEATPNVGLKTGESSSLRLTTTFNKLTAKINEEIVCEVKAERVGFSGYGMLLAEIGLPPGAEVDRASLESAMKTSDWAFSQYDILPDRVVVYLWPRAGGVSFNIKFRPRFALTAKTAPAVVYDYYNPEARAIVAPATFVVR